MTSLLHTPFTVINAYPAKSRFSGKFKIVERTHMPHKKILWPPAKGLRFDSESDAMDYYDLVQLMYFHFCNQGEQG